MKIVEITAGERDSYFTAEDWAGGKGIELLSMYLVPEAMEESSSEWIFLSPEEIEALYYVKVRRPDVREFPHLTAAMTRLLERGAIYDFGDTIELLDEGKRLYEACMGEEVVPERPPEYISCRLRESKVHSTGL